MMVQWAHITDEYPVGHKLEGREETHLDDLYTPKPDGEPDEPTGPAPGPEPEEPDNSNGEDDEDDQD